MESLHITLNRTAIPYHIMLALSLLIKLTLHVGVLANTTSNAHCIPKPLWHFWHESHTNYWTDIAFSPLWTWDTSDIQYSVISLYPFGIISLLPVLEGLSINDNWILPPDRWYVHIRDACLSMCKNNTQAINIPLISSDWCSRRRPYTALSWNDEGRRILADN